MNLAITALFLALCSLTLSFCCVYTCTRKRTEKEGTFTVRVDKELLVRAILNAWVYKDEDEEEDFEEGVECALCSLGLNDVYEAFELATTEYDADRFNFGRDNDNA